MSGSAQSEEKTLPPSAKKLREARKKGQIARSKEMVGAIVTVIAFTYLYARAQATFSVLREALAYAPTGLDGNFAQAAGTLAGLLTREVAWTVGPLVALIVAGAVLTNIVVNGGAVAAIDPILPKFERLNPVEGFKRLFALKTFVELLKPVVKVLIVGSCAGAIIALSLQALVEQPSCGLGCAPAVLGGLLRPLLIFACGFFLVIGALDIGIQRWLFRRDMRMTKTEQKRERKEQHGDPLIRGQLRRARRAAAEGAARSGVRNATFVLRSGQMSLAFRYAHPDAMVPILVARGSAEGTLLLVNQARAAQIPIVFDAVALRRFASMKVGQMVPQGQFRTIIGCMQQAGLL